jgi:hypothetical protein
MMATDRLPEIFSDTIRMENLVRQIERISESVSSIEQRLVGGVSRTGDKIKDITRDVKDLERSSKKIGEDLTSHEREMRRIDDLVWRTMRRWHDSSVIGKFGAEIRMALTSSYREYDQFRTVLDYTWKERQHEAIRQVSKARGALGSMGGNFGLGLSGTRGVAGVIQGQISDITAHFPMGGLLGMMLYGAQREEGFRAESAKILRTLDRIGGATKAQTREVSAEVRRTFHDWETHAEELAATMEKFTSASIDSAQQMSKVGGVTVTKLATAVDLASKLQAGTTAGAIGTAMAATGESVEELTKQFMALRGVSSSTRTDMAALMNLMVQGTSTLRLQRQGVGDLADAYGQLHQGLRQSGMSKGQASQAALTGLQAATGAIGGMQEGLMGYVAQRLQAKAGPGTKALDPFEALMSLKLGGSELGVNKTMTTSVVKELQTLLKERVGGSDLRRIGALEKLGFPLEAARAIVKMDGKGVKIADVQSAFKDPLKLIEEGNKKRHTEVNNWEAINRRIMQDIAKVGFGTLIILTAGFKGLFVGLPLLAKGRVSEATQAFSAAGEWEEKGFKTMAGGLSGLGKDVKNFKELVDFVDDKRLSAGHYSKSGDFAESKSTTEKVVTSVLGTALGGPVLGAVVALDELTDDDAPELAGGVSKHSPKFRRGPTHDQTKKNTPRFSALVQNDTGYEIEAKTVLTRRAATSKSEPY